MVVGWQLGEFGLQVVVVVGQTSPTGQGSVVVVVGQRRTGGQGLVVVVVVGGGNLHGMQMMGVGGTDSCGVLALAGRPLPTMSVPVTEITAATTKRASTTAGRRLPFPT